MSGPPKNRKVDPEMQLDDVVDLFNRLRVNNERDDCELMADIGATPSARLGLPEQETPMEQSEGSTESLEPVASTSAGTGIHVRVRRRKLVRRPPSAPVSSTSFGSGVPGESSASSYHPSSERIPRPRIYRCMRRFHRENRPYQSSARTNPFPRVSSEDMDESSDDEKKRKSQKRKWSSR